MHKYLENLNRIEFVVTMACTGRCIHCSDEKLETIAKYLKKKNHATISYGYNEIKKAIENDPSTKNTIDVLKKKINPN